MKWVQQDIMEHHTYYSVWELVVAMLASAAATAVVLIVCLW